MYYPSQNIKKTPTDTFTNSGNGKHLLHFEHDNRDFFPALMDQNL